MEDMLLLLLLLLCHCYTMRAGLQSPHQHVHFKGTDRTVLSGTGCGILFSWHHVHVNFCVSFPPSPISIPLPPPGGLATSLRLPADEWIQVGIE